MTPGELLTLAQSQLDNQKAVIQFEQHMKTISGLKEAVQSKALVETIELE